MRSKRIGIIVIGLLALATSAVIVLKRFHSAMAPPPAAVRETQAVESVLDTGDRWRVIHFEIRTLTHRQT